MKVVQKIRNTAAIVTFCSAAALFALPSNEALATSCPSQSFCLPIGTCPTGGQSTCAAHTPPGCTLQSWTCLPQGAGGCGISFTAVACAYH
jgi:hypothetical protein